MSFFKELLDQLTVRLQQRTVPIRFLHATFRSGCRTMGIGRWAGSSHRSIRLRSMVVPLPAAALRGWAVTRNRSALPRYPFVSAHIAFPDLARDRTHVCIIHSVCIIHKGKCEKLFLGSVRTVLTAATTLFGAWMAESIRLARPEWAIVD